MKGKSRCEPPPPLPPLNSVLLNDDLWMTCIRWVHPLKWANTKCAFVIRVNDDVIMRWREEKKIVFWFSRSSLFIYISINILKRVIDDAQKAAKQSSATWTNKEYFLFTLMIHKLKKWSTSINHIHAFSSHHMLNSSNSPTTETVWKSVFSLT